MSINGASADGPPPPPRAPGVDVGSLVGGAIGVTLRAVRIARARVSASPVASADQAAPFIDIPLGLGVGAAKAVTRAAGAAVEASRPLTELATRPAFLPRGWWPQTMIDRLAERGRVARLDGEAAVSALADSLVPTVVGAILDRTDLPAITQRVIDEIDLAGIIRESSGTMASESVLGVRMQGIEADEKVNRIVDRLLLRRGDRAGPAEPDASGS